LVFSLLLNVLITPAVARKQIPDCRRADTEVVGEVLPTSVVLYS